MQNIKNKKTFIIAEAGVNHNGSLERALEMVKVAKIAGADAVKFQTFKTHELVTKNAEKAQYQKNNDINSTTQYEMLKVLELDESAHQVLFRECQRLDIQFMSTPFDLESAQFLFELGMKVFKIPSGEITNYLLLKKIAHFKRPVIMSTGMSTLQDIAQALSVFKSEKYDIDQLTLLHCCSDYPAKMENLNLLAMKTMQVEFKLKLGYSDHSLGTHASVAAVAMGAQVIEKHFTLDKSLPGPDHLASLDVQELKLMITQIRDIELALGSAEKKPVAAELETAKVVRKSIVAKKKIIRGEIFTEDNLTVKRPGTGLSPFKWNELIGSKSPKDFSPDDLIEI